VELAVNTNKYAEIKRKGQGRGGQARMTPAETPSNMHSRKWTPTSASELKIWFGLTIKMGIHREPSISLHWSKEGRNGWRKTSFRPVLRQRHLASPRRYKVPKNCMSLVRYQQIRRYFHVSDPTLQLDQKDWYKKLSPLADRLKESFQKYYLPGTKIAIDEMMVRFCGRSSHTVKVKNKPIKQGYKIFALCSHGYTYGFLWYSISQGIAELVKLPNLTPTASGVYQLARLLPENKRWNLVLDNYFTNIPLFEELLKRGIGAAGTTRVDSQGFPACLKIEKAEAKKLLPWGYLSGAVVENTCCLVWQDNNSVLFMTTYHDITSTVDRIRRRPKKTSSNAVMVRRIFGDESRKKLPIPSFINDYNYHMGSVDIADQLRSYYSTQQRASRNWYPLFYWLLDTSIVNAYRLLRTLYPHQKSQTKHYLFRERLANKLIDIGLAEHLEMIEEPAPPSPVTESTSPDSNSLDPLFFSSSQAPSLHAPISSSPTTGPLRQPLPPNSHRGLERILYISARSKPPQPVQFPPPTTHSYDQQPTRTRCVFCRWKKATGGGSSTVQVRSVNKRCRECNISLCYECFTVFHRN